MMAWAWERRNAEHLLLVRSGAGSTPASVRISQRVEAASLTPRTRSSPWMRRYPPPGVLPGQAHHQHADRSVGGRPGRRGRKRSGMR